MYCIQHFVEPCDMYGYLLFRICNDHLNQRLFHSYVVSSFSFFHLVFLIVLLRHFLWFFCFHFANSTKFLGSSWERLLGHVCHATDKQADALGNIWFYIQIISCSMLDELKEWLWKVQKHLFHSGDQPLLHSVRRLAIFRLATGTANEHVG